MFAALRRLPDALASLVSALEVVSQLLAAYLERTEASGAVADRVDALERTRRTWEAEVEAALVDAESRFKAARSAEERTRHMAKKLEGEDDEEAAEGGEAGADYLEAYRRYLQEGHAPGGEEDGVHAMRSRVAPRDEKAALRARKFGL